MTVYLIEMDNGEMYEDHSTWIDSAFTTYRGATQYLLGDGFKLDYTIGEGGECYLCFDKKYDEYEHYYAEIVEMEVVNK